MVDVREERWSEGPVLEDPRLGETVLEHWAAAAALAGEEDDADTVAPTDVNTATAMLDDAAEWLEAELSDPAGDHAAAARLLIAGQRLATQVREAGTQWRARRFTQVHAALGRLRGATTVTQLMQLAPVELCRCGFDRAMLSRIEDSIGIPEAFHWTDDEESARRMIEVGHDNPIHLTHETLETEMIRRRGPLLVVDPQNDPRAHKALAEATGTRRYVAAPIMPEGKVIGFFHADCYIGRRLVDEYDRDLLWMFAEGFGYAYERTILLERLRSLREEVRRSNQSVLSVMDSFTEAELQVAPVDRDRGVTAPAPGPVIPMNLDSRLQSLLTRRELDVIRLMAAGETNAGIAVKLVVSEGTVKSHVKHILRKLRANNRAEAVSRFIRLTQQRSVELNDL